MAPDPKQYKKIGPRRRPAAMVRNAIPQARYAELEKKSWKKKRKAPFLSLIARDRYGTT